MNDTFNATSTFPYDIVSTAGTLFTNVTRLRRRPGPVFMEVTVGLIIVKWVFPLVILLGTLGNSLSLIVLLRKKMRTISVNVYLAVLACADTGVLFSNAFRIWIESISSYKIQHTSDAACKLVTYIFLVSIHMSAWLVVAISMDRFVAVWFPFKSLTWSSVRRARLVTLTGFIVLVVYNSYLFWTMHLFPNKNGRSYCKAHDGDRFMQLVYPWLKLATYSCIPFIIVLVLNCCIIYKIWQGMHNQKSNFKDSHSTASSKAEGKITTMLLSVSLCWLVLTAPFTLWSLTVSKTNDPKQKSRDILAKIICFLLMYINHACNFYIYCLTGKNFRKEFWNWLLCRSRVVQSGVSSMRTLRSSVQRSVYPEPEDSLLKFESPCHIKTETSPV